LLPVGILAGGLGTRLGPLTKHTPKALIPICGEPFIAHQLRLLRNRGVENVVICVGFLGEKICDFVGEGKAFKLNVQYSWDGPYPLGTAGALRKALPKLGTTFFVIYGDSYLPCNYREVRDAFLRSGKKSLMTVMQNDGQWDASNVQFSNDRIIAYDKQHRTPLMRYIDYGLGVFRSSVFETLPEAPCDLATVYQNLLNEGQIEGFQVKERFYEVGSLDGVRTLSEFLTRTTPMEDEIA